MTKKIIRSICLVAFLVLMSSVVLIFGVLYNHISKTQFANLKLQTELMVQGVDQLGTEYLKNIDTNEYRITLIDSSGSVVYDSHYNENDMENHLERDEIQSAMKSGAGESTRYSETLMERSLYYAKALDNGMVIRLSFAQSTILMLILEMISPVLLIIAIAFILSVILARHLSKSIVKPLNELNLDEPLENSAYDELSILLRRIDSQQKQLKKQESELQKKTDELDTIIGSMNEGLVLLNAKMNIISINKAAMSVLGIQDITLGVDMLSVCRNLDVQEILIKAREGERTEKNIEFRGSTYQVSSEPIFYEGAVKGIALVFFDVTEKEKAEIMRREFTANVSHELKTPLHSIAGYAELMSNNMVKEDDYVKFSEKIYFEARRMVSLVEDIIKLSRLDEGATDMKREVVDIYELVAGVVESLESHAKKSEVTVVLQGESVKFNCIRQLIQGVVYNLCDNAIKYNKQGGKVFVEICDLDEEIRLSVKDTGIGIQPEEQNRIFERFYRVDKSRSKEVGGTGLGLSIVKHAVLVHNGMITLDSVPQEGTTITVTFPKKED